MVVVVIAAILGAALGLFVRNGLVALCVSLVFTGAVQFALIELGLLLAAQQQYQDLAVALQGVVGDSASALAPSLAAAACSTGVAAFMLFLGKREKSLEFWLPGERAGPGGAARSNGVRAKSAVEKRAIHDRAESRIDKIMRM